MTKKLRHRLVTVVAPLLILNLPGLWGISVAHRFGGEKPPEANSGPSEPPSIEDMIVRYSGEYGAKADLALAIADAESNFENVCNIDSCDRGQGIFMFIPSTWESECEGEVMNPEDNIKCGVKLISEGEVNHWGTPMSWWGTYYEWQHLL